MLDDLSRNLFKWELIEYRAFLRLIFCASVCRSSRLCCNQQQQGWFFLSFGKLYFIFWLLSGTFTTWLPYIYRDTASPTEEWKKRSMTTIQEESKEFPTLKIIFVSKFKIQYFLYTSAKSRLYNLLFVVGVPGGSDSQLVTILFIPLTLSPLII